MTDTSTSLKQTGLDDRQQRIRRTLECLTGVAFTEGNQLTVLRNGEITIDRLDREAGGREDGRVGHGKR